MHVGIPAGMYRLGTQLYPQLQVSKPDADLKSGMLVLRHLGMQLFADHIWELCVASRREHIK